jgi:sensor histidine kinase regulating citrate/malate metabolism
MSFRSLSAAALLTLFAAACQSTPAAPCADTQAIVQAVAKEYPAVTRLTVHTTPPNGSQSIAVASTLPEKLGKPSDPEDLKAMKKGETVVIENTNELDVTVPILQKDGWYTGAAGVTFKTEKGTDKKQLTELAQAIAKVIDDRMQAPKK